MEDEDMKDAVEELDIDIMILKIRCSTYKYVLVRNLDSRFQIAISILYT